MSIIRELHPRLSRLTWRETAKADGWSRPLTAIVGVGFMEEIRTIISDAIRTAAFGRARLWQHCQADECYRTINHRTRPKEACRAVVGEAAAYPYAARFGL